MRLAAVPDSRLVSADAAAAAPLPAPAPAGVRVIRNLRPGVDWNTCGQAAIATLLARFALGPFAPGTASPSDGEAIDLVCRDFPPDLPFGLGTTAWRLCAALRHGGLGVEHVHSAWFGRNAEGALDRLRDHLDHGLPAIVCLDHGRLDGPAWSGHWAVALGMDAALVHLGNNGPAGDLPLEVFMHAWRCRHLPFAHNHCALLARREATP